MMFSKLLNFSTTIILASSLIGSNSAPAFAVKIADQSQISQSNNSYQLAQTRTYQVKLGDTLGGIAQKLGMSLTQILDYNPQLRSRSSLIYVGEIINLEGASTTSSSGEKYTVRSGDTLGGIAIRHGLSLSTLLSYNPQLASRPDRLNIGETINLGSAAIIRQTTSTPTVSPATSVASAFSGLPTERRSGSNSIGAMRGSQDEACTKAGKNMRAIAPDNGLGFTFDDYPYFFWYFPGVEAESVPMVFTLIGQEKREINGKTKTRSVSIHETALNLDKSGIIAFSLPRRSTPLKEEQEYQWRIQINCTPQTTMFLKYSIKRQSTNNPELIRQLETAPIDRHPVIFAESGIWFDALKMVALQLEQAPGDPILEQNWNNLLKFIGFDDLIGEPIQYIH